MQRIWPQFFVIAQPRGVQAFCNHILHPQGDRILTEGVAEALSPEGQQKKEQIYVSHRLKCTIKIKKILNALKSGPLSAFPDIMLN